jgi:hypothetical protein
MASRLGRHPIRAVWIWDRVGREAVMLLNHGCSVQRGIGEKQTEFYTITSYVDALLGFENVAYSKSFLRSNVP